MTAAATAANQPGIKMTARTRSATSSMRYWSHDHPVATINVAGNGSGLASTEVAAAPDAAHATALPAQDCAPAPPALAAAAPTPAAPEVVDPPEAPDEPDEPDAAAAAASGEPALTGVDTAAAPPVPVVHWVGPCLSQAGG